VRRCGLCNAPAHLTRMRCAWHSIVMDQSRHLAWIARASLRHSALLS
jgi:hypothetical protein